MQPAYINARAIDDRTIHAERCVGVSPPQSVSHDLEVLEKSVDSLRDSLRELNVQLDPVMNPEGPHGEGLAAMRASLSVCPLAERIRRITGSVQDLVESVDGTRRRLAL